MLGVRPDQRSFLEADHIYLDQVGLGSFYGFLAPLRGQLFRDQEFVDRYFANNGRNRVAPSLLATTLLLQAYDRVSDEEARARADCDIYGLSRGSFEGNFAGNFAGNFSGSFSGSLGQTPASGLTRNVSAADVPDGLSSGGKPLGGLDRRFLRPGQLLHRNIGKVSLHHVDCQVNNSLW